MPKNEVSNKYILDAIGRISIIIMIIFFEYRLVNKVAQEGCQTSVGLLAATVIIAGLLVLSLTLFRGSLEQDVQVLKENVSELKEKDLHKLNRDVEELKTDLKKLKDQIEIK
ncbi:hypothetical protein [Methanocrinis sp.]|uniref:hypothetical protein n=1 Tax=Methanocrinis sp. TaxID=3101522 RepID=UPI003D13B0C6